MDKQANAASDSLVGAACDQLQQIAITLQLHRPASPPTNNADSSSSESSQTDSEWLALPRLGFGLPQYMVSASALEADMLFRHRKLNPRDLVIDKPARELLRVVLRGVSANCEQLQEVHWRVALGEALAEAAISSANLPIATPRRGTTALPSGAIAEVDFFSVSEGDVLVPGAEGSMRVVRESRLPGSRLMREKREFIAVELAIALLLFFEGSGALTRDESDALQDEFLSAISGLQAKRQGLTR